MGDRFLPKAKKPGFLDNLRLVNDMFDKNPVSEPDGGEAIAFWGAIGF